MDYSFLYFGKILADLSYEDIELYFVESNDESDKIEYKSYFKLKDQHKEKEDGIIRTITGLLNSEGGLIVWGAPVGEKVSGKKEEIFQGQLSPIPMLIEKDRFMNRVVDSITPSPKGIRFNCLEKEGNYVVIVEVDQSSYSPHQFKNTYFMRIDGQTKPAPHHFIEALFRRVTFPKLEGYVKVFGLRFDGISYILDIQLFVFNKSKLQNEHDIYYRVDLGGAAFMFSPEENMSRYRSYINSGTELIVPNAKATLYYNEPNVDEEVVRVSHKFLKENENHFNIDFFFGGKQSPLLRSRYRINLTHEKLDRILYHFEIEYENMFAYEVSDALDTTEAEKMKIHLGR